MCSTVLISVFFFLGVERYRSTKDLVTAVRSNYKYPLQHVPTCQVNQQRFICTDNFVKSLRAKYASCHYLPRVELFVTLHKRDCSFAGFFFS